METYKRRLKRQNMALWCGIVLLAALDVVLGIFWDDLGLDVFQMTQQARTMQSMLLFGFLIYFIVRLVKNKRRLKDPWAYEEEARRQGRKVIRLDTWEGNLPANRLYPSLGYRYAGQAEFFFMGFVRENLNCYEKAL